MPITDHSHITTREAQDLLRFGGPDGTIAFLRSRGLVPLRRGRSLLWHRSAVTALIESLDESVTGKES